MDGLFSFLLASIDRQPAKIGEVVLNTAVPMMIAFVIFWVGARFQTIHAKPGWLKWAMAAPFAAYSCYKGFQFFMYIRDNTYADVLYSQGLNRVVYLHYAALPAAVVSIVALAVWAGILRQMSSDASISY